MRQNPIISSRIQVGGRPMPAWFSASLVNQARNTVRTPPLPPLPTEPPPEEESEYEEIEHLPRYTNMNINMRKSSGTKRICDLCGNCNAVVRCEMCNGQIFCGSCNDMYHRHPKRHSHVRKILENLENRPPLPPKVITTTQPQQQQQQHEIKQGPVAPPRRNRRFGMRSGTNSPTSTRKFPFDPMGSLKRFVGGMGERPLPFPPTKTSQQQLTTDFGRPVTPLMNSSRQQHDSSQNISFSGLNDRRHSTPNHPMNMNMNKAPQPRSSSIINNNHHMSTSMMSGGLTGRACIPLTVLEMSTSNYNNQRQNQSMSVANLHEKHPSRDSGYRGWEDDEDDVFSRSHSISVSNLNNLPASHMNHPHFATLQRNTRLQTQVSKPPLRQPPPVPPRDFSLQQHFAQRYQSASVFDLDRVDRTHSPWPQQPYPGEFQHQQANRMGYPGTLQRTPSTSSTGGGQAGFGWGPVGPFGPPMSQSEMELELLTRRESMPRELPCYGNQASESHLNNNRDPTRGMRKKPPQHIQASSTRQAPQQQYNPMSTNKTQHIEHDYYSGEFRDPQPQSNSLDRDNEEDDDECLEAFTDSPEGPWSCEHCTFLNPKSTRICTICCKTPTKGYRIPSNSSNYKPKTSIEKSDKFMQPLQQQQKQQQRQHQHQQQQQQLHYNTVEDDPDDDLAPVVKSKLSFSSSKATKDQRINLSVEQVRKVPWSTTSSSFDNNNTDSDSGEEVTQRQQHPPNKNKNKNGQLNNNKSIKIGNSNEEVYGGVPFQSWNTSSKLDIAPGRPIHISPSPLRVSTGVGSSPPKYMDSGVGDSIVHDTREEFISDQIMLKNDTPSVLTQLNSAVTPTKTSQSCSTSTSISISSLPSFFSSQKDSEAEKSSRGTSPPPQTISTQTYEELPVSKIRQMSVSKTSIQSGISSGDVSPPKIIEMSEKALRYARRAQQQTKLKRSLSTHLTSNTNDPWVDVHHHEGRHLYRSSSRHSLASDTRSLPISGPPSRDVSPPPHGHFNDDMRRFPPASWDRFPSPADYFASVDDLVGRKRRESMRSQEFELSRLLKEAEEFNYTPEDLQVALRMCGDRNPIKWLQENWSSMIETVQTLATKYGREKGHELNEVGTISSSEAKEALRLHRGNVWAAVTECVEQRRKKFLELQSRGTFLREDILTALTANHGNLDAAYVELSKAQLKPFLMRIWGPPNGLDNNEAYSRSPSIISLDMDPANVNKNVNNSRPIANVSDLNTPVGMMIESPMTIHEVVENKPIEVPEAVTEVEAIATQIKSDGEDERFVDAVSDSDSSSDQNKFTVQAQNEDTQQSRILTKTVSISDPELEGDEVEAHISHFIQNYEISEPKVISNLIQAPTENPNEFASSNKTQENGNKNKEEPTTFIQPEITTVVKSNEKSTSEIVSLTMAVNAISLQLETLLKQQQETPPTYTSPTTSVDNTEVDQIKENSQMNLSENNNSSTNPVMVQESISKNVNDENEIKILKNIYKDDLQRLKEIVLDTDTDDDRKKLVEHEEQHTMNYSDERSKVYEIIEVKQNVNSSPPIKEQVKSRPYKLYEAIGNFAGTFLKSAMKIDQKSFTDTTDTEKIYETIQIPRDSEEVKEEKNITKEKSIDLNILQEENKSLALTEKTGTVDDQPSVSHSEKTELIASSSNINFSSKDNPKHVDDMDEENHSNSSESFEDSSIPTRKILKEFLTRNRRNKNNSSNSNSSESESFDDDEEEDGVEMIDSVGESSLGESSVSESISDGVFENDIVQSEQSDIGGEEGQVYEDIDLTSQSGSGINKNEIEAAAVETIGIDESNKQVKLVPSSPGEIEIQRLMNTGLANSYETAEIAVKLMDMNFDEEDSLYAAKECSSLYSALSFLQQECLLCAGKLSAKQMVSMLRCTHWCCRTCAAGYFMVQLRDHPIVEAVCPFCKEPTSLSEDPEVATDYFSHLDILLKDLLDEHYHEMFIRKLRDWTLAKTPNFKWCSKCSSGFITDPAQTHLVCPDCSAVTCAICLEPWDKENHSHRDRGRSNSIYIGNSPEITINQSIIEYLNQNCIECPRCHLKFTLARGGCMHLTCSQCCYEFCSGCLSPFRIGSKCSRNTSFCIKLGLHAHHPRNCLFYLRDKEPETLAKLLEEKEIAYFKETPSIEDVALKKISKCQVPIQKENEDGLQDDLCGQDVLKGYTTVCQTHYVEYLGLLIWLNRLDPISILSNDDLETIIKRDDKRVPGKPYGTKDSDYRPLLLKVIEDQIPLSL